jgi:hypothetical protein
MVSDTETVQMQNPYQIKLSQMSEQQNMFINIELHPLTDVMDYFSGPWLKKYIFSDVLTQKEFL